MAHGLTGSKQPSPLSCLKAQGRASTTAAWGRMWAPVQHGLRALLTELVNAGVSWFVLLTELVNSCNLAIQKSS